MPKILTPDDWQKLKTIRLEGWTTDPQAFWGDRKLEENGFEEYWHGLLTDPERLYVGIEENDKLVSIAGTRMEDGKCILMAVYTSVTARGRGLSKQLVHMCIDEVKKKGYSQISLYVTEGQEAAIGMYTNMGFKLTGVEKDCKMGDGLRHNELIMEREI